MATNWKLLSVDEPPSDDEVEVEVSDDIGTVLSPASKRARKRAAARDRKLAKTASPPTRTPASEAALGTFSVPPPAASIQSTLAASSDLNLDKEKPPKGDAMAMENMKDDVSATSEEEDVSLLMDESSSSSEDDEGKQQPTNESAEPATPKAVQRAFKSTAHDALDNGRVADALGQDEDKAAAAGASQEPLQYGSDHDPSKKMKAVVTRTVWTLVMIAGFCALVLAGPVYLIMMIIVFQALVFKEISALFDVAARPTQHHHHHPVTPSRARARAERERWSKVLSWYFFAAVNYFLHGETIIYYFKHIVFVDAYFIPFARHHRFISFMLYVLGFVGFVTNLKRNQLRRQFGLFCWIHMSLLLIVVSSHFIVNNILEGIIWFWVPASLVVMNDIAAYVWGMLFGKTQLIKLSPKKTVEGFVGAFFTTVVFGYVWATLFMRFNYMICPATDLGTTAFSNLTCAPNDVFIWRSFVLPQEIGSVHQIPWAPFQFHAVIMAIFASLVAPFGGFFASGFKRAFNVKDFGDSIPGHGGMTDRMDCQFLMGLFAYVYYSSIIRDNHVTVGAVMQTVVSSLSSQEQVELVKALTGHLAQQGIEWR